ncbi:hypothetical protein R6242_14360 [Iodobacter sp. CM08]|uniref:hypothetical protein n=1 Tax=Iodobacter sp. CM08 TaxID=3085902 RepID=UPI002980DC29|nr:hypothetical protein [Iodobacter sp. CM08]MDW5417750.1 hypothetical protein [Iodobacter sp. CM08]
MATFPNSLAPSAINMGSQSTTLVSKSHSGKRQARKFGTTLVTFDVSWTNLNRVQMGELWGFVQAQSGQFGVFDFFPALYRDSSNSNAPVSAIVGVIALARQRRVQISGLPASKTVLNAGDLIRFDNHPKAYLLAEPTVSDASGNAVMVLTFDLLRDVPATRVVFFKYVGVQMSLVDDAISLNQRPPFWHDLSLKLIETI